jgi:hypothetical protein
MVSSFFLLFVFLCLGNKSTYFLVPSFYGCQSAIFSQRARDYALLANKHIPILYCHLNDHLLGNGESNEEETEVGGRSLSSAVSQLQHYSSALYDKANKKQYRFILNELIKTIKLSISSTNANKAILEMLDLTSISGNSLLYSILIQMPTSTVAHETSSASTTTTGGSSMALSEINAFLFQPSSYSSSAIPSSLEVSKQSPPSSVEASSKENARLLNQLVKSNAQSHQTSVVPTASGNEKVDYGAMLEYNALFKYENENANVDSNTGKKKKKGAGNNTTKRGSVGENNRRITNWKDFFPLIISSEWNDSNTSNHQHHYILPPYVLSEISYAWLPRFFAPDVIKLCRNNPDSVTLSSNFAAIKHGGSIRSASPSKIFPSTAPSSSSSTVPSANDYENYIYNNLLMLSMSKENPSLPESCGILFEELEASLLSVMNSTHSIIHTRLTADIRMKLRNMNKLEMRVTATVLTLWQLVQYLQCNLLEQYYLHLSSVSTSTSSASPSSFLSTLLSSVVSSVSWSSCLNAFNLWQLSRIMIKISDILSFPWKQIMELSKVQKLRQSILLINTPTGLLSSSSLSAEQAKENDQKALLQELLSKQLFQQGISSLMDSFSNIHYSFYSPSNLSPSSSSSVSPAKEKKDNVNKTAATKSNKLAMFNIFNVLKGDQTIPIEIKGKAAREARRTITMMMSNKGEKLAAAPPQEEQINQNNSNNLKRVSALFASPKPFNLASSSGSLPNEKKQSLLMPPPSFSTNSPSSPNSKAGKSPSPPSVSFAASSTGPTPSAPSARNPNSLRAQKQQRKHLKKLEETRNIYLDSLLSLSLFSIHEKLPNIQEILKDQLISHISASSTSSSSSVSMVQDAQDSIQSSFFQRISSMVSYYLAEVIIHQISLQEMKDEMERLQQQHPTKRRSSLLVSPNAATANRRHPSILRRQSMSKNRSPSPSANNASPSPTVSPDKSTTAVSAARQPSASDLSALAKLASTEPAPAAEDQHEQHRKQLSDKLEKTEENLLKLVNLVNETKNEIHQKDQYKDSDKLLITPTTTASSLKKQKSSKKSVDSPEGLFGQQTKVISHRASNKINITSVLTNFRNKLNDQGGKESSSSSSSSSMVNVSPDIMFGSLFPEDMLKCMLKWTFDGNQIQEIHQRRQSMNFLLNKSSSISNMSRSNSVLLAEGDPAKNNEGNDSNTRRRSSVVDTAFIEEFTTPHIVNTRKINRKRILRSIIAYAGKIRRGEVKWGPRQN